MHPRRLFAVLGLVVLTSMTSCTSFSSSRSPSMDKTGWITHCFGRFLIDLPPDAVINAGYYLWGDNIQRLDGTPAELAARIAHREQELRNGIHKKQRRACLFGGRKTRLEPLACGLGIRMLVCFLIGLTHILWLIPRERFFYTQEKLLTTKRRKGRKLSMIYPEAFALASPKKLQLSRAFALIMPILQGRVFKMKSLA